MSLYARLNEHSDPFLLEIVDRDDLHPGPGQVRVRIRAAGLNPVDWKIAVHPQIAARYGVDVPGGFGNDFAGEIDEVGEGVAGFAVGDRVFGGARGHAMGEHTIVTIGSDIIASTPDGVDDITSATLAVAGRTAAAALHAVGISHGDTVLIGGAAGGVGVFAVQLAVAAGATVIGTSSPANFDFLADLGAIPVAHGDGLLDRVREAAPDGVDAALDLHGTDTALAALELGVAPGRIATIAAGPNAPEGTIVTGGADADAGALDDVAARIAAGTLRVPIQATFPLAQVNDAVAALRTGHVSGKLVVTM